MNSSDFQASLKQLGRLVEDASTILVLQPEKPDTDSLCSTLALEHILGDLGKRVVMYSRDALPPYISYFQGADRLVDELPAKYDLAILVDTGGAQQVERTLEKYQGRLAAKPFVIIDHHATRSPLPFGTIDIIDAKAAATGELLVKIANQLGWVISPAAAALIVPAIMSDTLGLTTPNTTADTIATVADMVRLGADLYTINKARLEAGALDQDVFTLKARLMQQVEFLADGQLALLVVDPATLKDYAKRYDPSALVVYDMQHVRGVQIAIVIRNYSPKIKLSLRSNAPIAANVAAVFGGGGHPQAAGATVESGTVESVRDQVVAAVKEQLQANTV